MPGWINDRFDSHVYYTSHQNAENKEWGNKAPCDLPIPPRSASNHVLDIILKPEEKRKTKISLRGKQTLGELVA